MRPDAEAIADWMVHQRWYQNKPRRPALEVLEVVPLPGSERAAECVSVLLAERSDDGRERCYQVPLLRRSTTDASEATIVQRDGDEVLVDAVNDPRFVRFALAACGIDPDGDPIVESRPLAVEQSNSSVIVRRAAGDTIVVKVFRVVQAGSNPDVELLQVLSETRPQLVPRFDGRFATQWRARGGSVHGDLMLVEEFAAGAADAWNAALTNPGLAAELVDLGRATRRLHAALAERLGTWVADHKITSLMHADLDRRLALTIEAVPALAGSAGRIRARYAAAFDGQLPSLQRIHGDLHLGQILRYAGVGRQSPKWLFIDFEGEPLRPLAERSQPDFALRDVAGILRSLDYAGASAAHDPGWSESAKANFLSGYFGGGVPLESRQLLAALVLDKAVYEARYEAGNRPEWLGIPLAAIQNLLERE